MFRFFRRHQTLLFSLLALLMVSLPFFGVGGTALLNPQQVIIKINDHKITQAEFDQIYHQLERQKPVTTDAEKKTLRATTLQELIRLNVLNAQAEDFGLEVPDQELQLQLANNPAFQTEGKFDWQKYAQTIYQKLGMRPKDFEAARKKDLRINKLNQLLFTTVHIPEATIKETLNNRLKIETDPKKKKELIDHPETIENELRENEASYVYQDWIGQINSRLNVRFTSSKLQSEFPQAPK